MDPFSSGVEKDDHLEEVARTRKELEAFKNQHEDAQKSWLKEREEFESKVKSTQDTYNKLYNEVENFRKYTQENPHVVARQLMDYYVDKTQPQQGNQVPQGNLPKELMDELNTVKKLTQEQSKKLSELELKNQIDSAWDQINDSLDELESDHGFRGDPRDVVRFMAENGFTNPNQAKVATNFLYQKQILDNVKKSSKGKGGVVMGGNGYPSTSSSEEYKPNLPDKYNLEDAFKAMKDAF